jgi:hypothetical protein
MVSYLFFINFLIFFVAHIPLFLYPFLNTSNNKKPFENLRVTSLGVIGALVKVILNNYSKGR